METVSIALWAANLEPPLNGVEGWAAGIEAKMKEAKADGARLLVTPEYHCQQWLSFAPEGIRPNEEIPWLASQGPAALEVVRPLARRYGLGLLAGTMPVSNEAGGFLNRAHLFLPDGREVVQDKLCLTPAERDPSAWYLETGDEIAVIEWEGLRFATLICLDIELPALAARLAPLDLDLILVPSMTSKLSGFHRVFGCARARAIELMTTVGAVGAIGVPERLARRDTNTSAAAAFLPCEEVLGSTGVPAALSPTNRTSGAGPMLVASELPIALVRSLRRGKAEVWPGPWSADAITLREVS
ncbi:MAG TPA: nitrilase-related carbon-nitrogen hydrolase [Alphaproteobacteria bacterium]|nr:nitrilase-related carbon-nitrogen hydrolase [Alphaproteobacteria bacterium]